MKTYIVKSGELRKLAGRRVSWRQIASGFIRAVCAALLVFLLVYLAACDIAEQTETTPPPSPRLLIETPSTLYCAAYGIRVDVPEGWLFHSRNISNLTASNSATTLERTEHESGYGVALCELWSEESSANVAHASVALYVEVFDDTTLDEYIEALTTTLNSRRDGYISALSFSETQSDVDDREWHILVAAITPPNETARYIEEYRISELEGNTYFTACITWWEDSTASLEAATLARTVFAIEG